VPVARFGPRGDRFCGNCRQPSQKGSPVSGVSNSAGLVSGLIDFYYYRRAYLTLQACFSDTQLSSLVKSHFHHRCAAFATCVVAGVSIAFSCNCSAQGVIAADYATNSIYSFEWTEVFTPNDRGQNGGYGFGAWNMWHQVGPNHTGLHTMDRTSPYNPFGTAWTLYNPYGLTPNTWPGDNFPQPPTSASYAASPGTCVNPPTGYSQFGPNAYDLSQAGRALPNGEVFDPGSGFYSAGPGLQIGQTFTTVISNPTDRAPYGGYTVSLQNWPENRIQNHTEDVIAVGTFEYFGSLGRWYTPGTYDDFSSRPFADLDTTTNGMQIDITITGTTNYHLVLTPLGNLGKAFSEDGNFANPGPVVWVTYELYNTDSNFYPPGGDYSACGGPDRTDFYIKSMTVSSLELNIKQLGTNVLLTWQTNVPGFALESTTNLGPAAAWNPVSPGPSVVNGLNTVTNPIAASRQFYRLRFAQ
jgi:hypothetical protein